MAKPVKYQQINAVRTMINMKIMFPGLWLYTIYYSVNNPGDRHCKFKISIKLKLKLIGDIWKHIEQLNS